MATLQISEYTSVQSSAQGDTVHVAQTPPIQTQAVTYTAGTAVDSLPFHENTRFIRVATDDTTDANIAFGLGASPDGVPQATNVHDRLPADAVGFWGINPTAVDRLNVS